MEILDLVEIHRNGAVIEGQIVAFDDGYVIKTGDKEYVYASIDEVRPSAIYTLTKDIQELMPEVANYLCKRLARKLLEKGWRK